LAAPVHEPDLHDMDLDHTDWLNYLHTLTVDQDQNLSKTPPVIDSHASHMIDARLLASATSSKDKGTTDSKIEARRARKRELSRLYYQRYRQIVPPKAVGRPPKELNPLDPDFDQKVRKRAYNTLKRQRVRYDQESHSIQDRHLHRHPRLHRDAHTRPYKRLKDVQTTPDYAQRYLSAVGLDLGHVDWNVLKPKGDATDAEGQVALHPVTKREQELERRRVKYQNLSAEVKRDKIEKGNARRRVRKHEQKQAIALGMSYEDYKTSLKPVVGPEEQRKAEQERVSRKRSYAKRYQEKKMAKAASAST
jgi:hypothetical protein